MQLFFVANLSRNKAVFTCCTFYYQSASSCFSRTETLVKNATYKFRWGENSMQTTIDDRKLDTKVNCFP